MKRKDAKKILAWGAAGAFVLWLGLGALFSGPERSVGAMSGVRLPNTCVIIDAGHGGEDGGAVSVSGAVESEINLAIALRLDQLLAFYGVETLLLRSEDVSLHAPGARTLREKKVSDLHNRAARIADVENAALISIHQNTYAGSPRYHGAQVFFAPAEESAALAEHVQQVLRTALDPENGRSAARIPESVYLMNHVTCPAVLVECGFLSNPEEDRLLQSESYQKKLAAALAGAWLSAPGEIGERGAEAEPSYWGKALA